jgi:hypothetical protein
MRRSTRFWRDTTPALPAGLTARILRDVPLRPQFAASGLDALTEAPVRLTAQVVPLRVVGGTDHGTRRPLMVRLAAWRGAWLMLGGTGIGALAASVAAIAIFGSPFQPAPVAGAGTGAGSAGGMVALAAAPSSPLAAPPATAARAGCRARCQSGHPSGTALAVAAPPISAGPQTVAVPTPDTSDPDPVLPPAVVDHSHLAAQSPDPGPDGAATMGPTLGATRGAMGPFVPQGYGYSGAIGGAPGAMGPGGGGAGTMQSMPGHMPRPLATLNATLSASVRAETAPHRR